jgi:hypothetical protein
VQDPILPRAAAGERTGDCDPASCSLTIGGVTTPLRFVPYPELAGRPSVVVDGAPAEGTVLCLTHWPGIECPADLRADLSAEMAFAYGRELAAGVSRHEPAEIVSNNHFDQDGLVSVFALAAAEDAVTRERFLVAVARAGDFGTFTDRDAARVSMVLSAYATPDRSPLTDLPEDYPAMAARLYLELLPRLSELCDHPERWKPLWEDEDASLSASIGAISSATSTLDEDHDLDLAVLTVDDAGRASGGHRFAAQWRPGLHPMAVANATACFTVLVACGRRYELTCRYETWVQYQSRRPRARVDLGELARQLTAEERDGAAWTAEPPSALTPRLFVEEDAESSLPPATVRRLVAEHLRTAPPAWDPYAWRP